MKDREAVAIGDQCNQMGSPIIASVLCEKASPVLKYGAQALFLHSSLIQISPENSRKSKGLCSQISYSLQCCVYTE